MAVFREQLKPRFAVFGGLVLLALGVLLVRLWSMQVLSAEGWAKQADENRIREISLAAPRGRLLDRKGRPLVTNRASMGVLVSPSARGDKNMLGELSALIGVPVSEIEGRLSSVKQGALEPRVVALDVSPQVVAYLAEHESRFENVEVRVVPVRQYPQSLLAAHVLGYTGEISQAELDAGGLSGYQVGDTVGKTGAERQFESVLQGDRGTRRIEVDARGRPRRVLAQTEPVAGRDVRLTIDIDAQKVAEEALAKAMEDAHDDGYKKAKAGAVVALDVRTGEVLAMASAPTYDPKLFIGGISQADWKRLNAKSSEYPLNNRAVMSAYPPASTFKAVTGLAGLRYRVTSEWHLYDCRGKWIEMGEQWPKWCWNKAGHGEISFHRGITQSCDTVFYEIGYAFYKQKDEKLQRVAREFGIGQATGIDLPGEVRGRVPDAAWKRDFNKDYPEYRTWLPGDTVNMAIGQGDLLATPLQMAQVYATVANDGKVVRPHVLKDVLDLDGKVVRSAEVTVAGRVDATKGEFGVVRRGLLSVTEEGTARSAFRGFGAGVLGKTGTAEVYGKDDYAWFVGVAPAEKPRYVVAVLVEQGGHGGSVAAPAARQVLGQLLGLKVEHVRAQDVSR